jgi:carboxymethylenebutenolidase
MPIRRDFTFTSAAGRRLRAFYAEPELDGEPAAPLPAVIVVHEVMGLNDDIRSIAARFADSGYVALAPDLVGDGFRPFCIARFVNGMGRVGHGRPYREMRAFQDWLTGRPIVDAGRVGMAGFCAGGGFAILYAARGDRDLRAIAPFYGAMPADESIIPDVCPVVASYGARDGTFGKTGPKLEAALDAAGIPNDVRTYPDAGHSFMNHHDGLMAKMAPLLPMRAGFNEAASEDAWGRVLAFFGEHLAPRGTGTGTGSDTGT